MHIIVTLDLYPKIKNNSTCRVTICNPNPEELSYKLNEPNTINL